MPDMLVRLYALPDPSTEVRALQEAGIVCRRAETFERSAVVRFVGNRWPHWRDEADAGFARVPATLYIAVADGTVAGFACYNVTRPNFFGPTAVARPYRNRGIGRALLLQCLEALRAEGYAYAIIGGVGPAAFYERAVGATLIEGSEAGIYGGRVDA